MPHSSRNSPLVDPERLRAAEIKHAERLVSKTRSLPVADPFDQIARGRLVMWAEEKLRDLRKPLRGRPRKSVLATAGAK